MPKILVSDYDGTLYTDLDDFYKNLDSINKFIKEGNIFIIATGRNYLDISKLVEHYNIPYNYIICNDGGTIFNNLGNLIYKRDIPNNISSSILNYLINNNLFDITYIDTGFDYTKNLVSDVNAIIIKDINREKSELLLNNILNTYEGVTGYISDNWINITEKNVNKSNGIKFLCQRFNYNKNDIYTIGNTVNDISMIKDFDGACVSSSTSDLKSICSKEFNSVSDYINYIMKK